MPELPEVENSVTALRDVKPSLIGLRIEQVNILSDNVISGSSDSIFRQQLEGCEFASIGRHGKYLFFGIKSNSSEHLNKLFMIIHLRMTGRLLLVAAHEAAARHTRLAFMLNNGLALRFDDPRKFGRALLAENTGEICRALGPDALTVPFEIFAGRCKTFRRQIKPLLLDQSFLAGIGNIYADEILFRAGIHPLLNSGSLELDDLRRLHDAVVSVLEEAVAAGGANIDGVFKAGGFLVSVYGRNGTPCRICGTEIVKMKVGQRGTHFCPKCQRLHGVNQRSGI